MHVLSSVRELGILDLGIYSNMVDPFPVIKFHHPNFSFFGYQRRAGHFFKILYLFGSVQAIDPSTKDIDDIDWNSEDDQDIQDTTGGRNATSNEEVKLKSLW